MSRITALQCIAFIFAVFTCTKTSCDQQPLPIVETIQLQSSGCINSDEFEYLTDIHVGSPCSEECLAKAREILSIKKRFKTISLSAQINPSTDKLIITCVIEPNIILKKVKIRGILNNKSQYEHLYNQQAGDIFSIQEHAASVKAIQERLRHEGFLNGTVTDKVTLHESSKTISVKISIDTGPRFYISHVQYALQLPNTTLKEQPIKDIHTALDGIFNPLIRRYQYTQSTIKNWTKKIKKSIINAGFLNPKIRVRIKADRVTRKVNVLFIATISTQRFVITGNRACSTQELFNALLSHVGHKWNLKPAAIKHQIKLHYQTKGFWGTKIDLTEDHDTIFIKIDEENPLTVSQIIIHDRHKKPLIYPIMALAKLTSTTRCSNIFIRDKLSTITQAAIKNGFWDCKIKKTKLLIPKTNPSTCIIDITIDPGIQRILNAITIKPNKAIPSLRPSDLTSIYNQKPFDPQIITDMRRSLLNTLYKNGYWYASAECSIKQSQLHPAEQTLNLSMVCNVDIGKQVLFGKVITQGYSKLPFKQIIKNCPFQQDTLWDQKKVDSSRARLHQLGIFEHVQLTPYQLGQHKSPKHIIANILDDDPFEVRLKIGAFTSNAAPFLEEANSIRLAGTYLVKNPLNKADIFSINAQADSIEQQLSAEYLAPDLFGTNQLNTLQLITENHRYMLNLCDPIEAVLERRSGFKISAYQDLTLNHPQWGWEAGMDHSRLLSHYGNMNLDPSLTEKSLFFLYFSPKYRKISIEERKTMSEGFETNAELKFSFPIVSHGNSPAIRFAFGQRFAKNLHRSLGIIVTLRCGHLFADGGFANIHPNDRFYLGGADSIRGYSRDTLPPLGTYTMRNGKTGYTVQGGRGMLQANLELRYRINHNAELQVFHDIGALSQHAVHEFFVKQYKTIGIGTRLYTPVGIVKFDIGWKLDLSYPEEHSYNWHLSFDGSF